MKYILLILCIQCFIFSAFSEADKDSLCFRLTQFEKIRGNELRNKSSTDHICSNFTINELPADSNHIIKLYEFDNVLYEEMNDPGFILVENNKIEIYDIYTFSHLIKRIVNSDVHPETLKKWIVIILERYDMFIYETGDNIIFKYNKGRCDFFVTGRSIKRK